MEHLNDKFVQSNFTHNSIQKIKLLIYGTKEFCMEITVFSTKE